MNREFLKENKFIVASFFFFVIFFTILFFVFKDREGSSIISEISKKEVKIFSVEASSFGISEKIMPKGTNNIEINLSHGIDKESFSKDMIKFYPEREFSYSIKENSIFIDLQKSVELNETFEIVLSSDIKNNDGEFLNKQYSYVVSGVPETRVLSLVKDDAENPYFTATFSNPMTALTNLENKDTECLIKITPEVEHRCKWVNTYIQKLIPSKPLTKSQSYKVYSEINGENKEITFDTPRLSFSLSSKELSDNGGLILTSSTKVSLEELKSKISYVDIKPFGQKSKNSPKLLDNIISNNQDDVYKDDENYIEKNREDKGNFKTINSLGENKFEIILDKKIGDYDDISLGIKEVSPLEGNLKSEKTHKNIVIPGSINYIKIGFEKGSLEEDNFNTDYKYFSYRNFQDGLVLPKTKGQIAVKFGRYGVEEEYSLNNLNFLEIVNKDTGKRLPYEAKIVERENSNGEKELYKDTVIYTFSEKFDGEYDFIFTPTNENGLISPLKLTGKTLPDLTVDSVGKVSEGSVVIHFKEQTPKLSKQNFNTKDGFITNVSNGSYNCRTEKNKNCVKIYGYFKPNSEISLTISGVEDGYYSRNINEKTLKFKYPDYKPSEIRLFGSRNTNTIPAGRDIGLTVSTTFSDKFNLEYCYTNQNDFDNGGQNYKCETKTVETINNLWTPTKKTFNVDKLFGNKFDDKKVIRLGYYLGEPDYTVYKDLGGEKYKTNKNFVYFFRIDGSIIASCGYAEKSQKGENCLAIATNMEGKNISSEVEMFSGNKKLAYSKDISGFYFDNENSDVSLTAYGLDSSYYSFLDLSYHRVDYSWGSTNSQKMAYLFPDRPIYKPGDTVNYKGILRNFTPEGFKYPYEFGKVNFELRNDRYEKVFEKEVEVNEKGEFSVDFVLPEDSILGRYRPVVNDFHYTNNDSNFYLEEYVSPVFKVDINTQKDNYLVGDEIKFDITSDYYFGGKLGAGDIKYQVLRQKMFINPEDYKEYNFTENRNRFYGCYYWGDCSFNDGVETYGETSLQNGYADVLFDSSGLTGNKIYTLNATVSDNLTGKDISATGSVNIYATDGIVGLKSNYFFPEDEKISFDGVLLDIDEKPKSGKVDIEIIHLEHKKVKKSGIDGFYYSSYSEVENLEKKLSLNTGIDGEFSYDYLPSKSGNYKIKARYTGSNGTTVSAVNDLYVAGDGYNSYFSNSSENELFSETIEANIGEEVEYNFVSEIKTGTAYVFVGSMSSVDEVFELPVSDSSFSFKVPVKDKYYPSYGVKVMVVGKENPDDVLPKFYHGGTTTKVNVDNKEINFKITSDKQKYLPGEEVEVKIKSNDLGGQALPNVSGTLAVVDSSVLALKGNPKRNIFSFFYDFRQNFSIPTFITLTNLVESVEINESDGAKGGDGDLTKGGDSKKKRGEFRDTAHYVTDFSTDENGDAVIKFKLPDNTTTWRIELVGATKDKFGVGYSTFLATKKALVLPNLPQFIGESDEIVLEPAFFNKTDKIGNFDISLSSKDLEIDDINRVIKILPGESLTQKFKVKPKSGIKSAKIKIKMLSKDLGVEDIVEKHIRIIDNNYIEKVASGNFVDKELLVEEKIYFSDKINDGKVTIKYFSDIYEKLKSGIITKKDLYFHESPTHYIIKQILFIDSLENSLGNNLSFDETYGNVWLGGEDGYDEMSYSKIIELYLSNIKSRINYNDGGIKPTANSKMSSDYHSVQALSIASLLRDKGFSVDGEFYEEVYDYIHDEFKKSLYNKEYQYLDSEMFIALDSWKKDKYSMYKHFIANEKYFENNGTALYALYQNESLSDKEKDYIRDILNKHIENTLPKVNFNPRGANINYSLEETINLMDLIIKLESSNADNMKLLGNMANWVSFEINQNKHYPRINYNLINVLNYLKDIANNTNYNLKLSLNNEVLKEEYIEKTSDKSSEVTIDIDSLEGRNTISFEKSQAGPLYYDLISEYSLDGYQLKKVNEGFDIGFDFYDYDQFIRVSNLKNKEYEAYNDGIIEYGEMIYPNNIYEYLTPVEKIKKGDILIARYTLNNIDSRGDVVFEGYIPSGTMLVNPELDTNKNHSTNSVIDMGYFDRFEIRSDRLVAERNRNTRPGNRGFSFLLKATNSGKFNVKPSEIREIDYPEIFGRTGGYTLEIE